MIRLLIYLRFNWATNGERNADINGCPTESKFRILLFLDYELAQYRDACLTATEFDVLDKLISGLELAKRIFWCAEQAGIIPEAAKSTGGTEYSGAETALDVFTAFTDEITVTFNVLASFYMLVCRHVNSMRIFNQEHKDFFDELAKLENILSTVVVDQQTVGFASETRALREAMILDNTFKIYSTKFKDTADFQGDSSLVAVLTEEIAEGMSYRENADPFDDLAKGSEESYYEAQVPGSCEGAKGADNKFPLKRLGDAYLPDIPEKQARFQVEYPGIRPPVAIEPEHMEQYLDISVAPVAELGLANLDEEKAFCVSKPFFTPIAELFKDVEGEIYFDVRMGVLYVNRKYQGRRFDFLGLLRALICRDLDKLEQVSIYEEYRKRHKDLVVGHSAFSATFSIAERAECNDLISSINSKLNALTVMPLGCVLYFEYFAKRIHNFLPALEDNTSIYSNLNHLYIATVICIDLLSLVKENIGKNAEEGSLYQLASLSKLLLSFIEISLHPATVYTQSMMQRVWLAVNCSELRGPEIPFEEYKTCWLAMSLASYSNDLDTMGTYAFPSDQGDRFRRNRAISIIYYLAYKNVVPRDNAIGMSRAQFDKANFALNGLANPRTARLAPGVTTWEREYLSMTGATSFIGHYKSFIVKVEKLLSADPAVLGDTVEGSSLSACLVETNPLEAQDYDSRAKKPWLSEAENIEKHKQRLTEIVECIGSLYANILSIKPEFKRISEINLKKRNSLD